MKFEPEFEAKRVEWLQRFSDALEELRRTYASKMSLMIDRVLDIAKKGRASKGTEEKCDGPTEVKFFGMTLGASREETAARLAEMGFALAPAKGRSKKQADRLRRGRAGVVRHRVQTRQADPRALPLLLPAEDAQLEDRRSREDSLQKIGPRQMGGALRSRKGVRR